MAEMAATMAEMAATMAEMAAVKVTAPKSFFLFMF
jgi:hypothetical protein